jgi:alpha-ribazole phosphatase/probable phosphoglycerate mutase
MSGLLFIRHAETDMAGTFCGHSDPPINSCGRAQITDLLARLVPETFEAIYASDLRRAVNTAEALAETFGVPLTTTLHLREIHFGDWEGLTWAEIEQRDAVYARRWTEAFPALPAPNGETFSAFELRVLQEVENLVRLAESKRIAVVTHGGVMRVVLRTFLGYSEQQAWELTEPYCSSFACAAGVASQEVIR